MEGFLIRGRDVIHPAGGACSMAQRTPGWGFTTPWRAVSNRGITVFVPDLLELYICLLYTSDAADE